MFPAGYFGTTTISGGGGVSTVATALKDTREPTGQLPPAKIARIHVGPLWPEDKVYQAELADTVMLANNTLLFDGLMSAQFWKKTDDLPGGGLTEPDISLVYAKKWNATTDFQDTVYQAKNSEYANVAGNTNKVGFKYAQDVIDGLRPPVKTWNKINNYIGSTMDDIQIIPKAGFVGGAFEPEPYDPNNSMIYFEGRDTIYYWNVATNRTTLQAELADPWFRPDGTDRNNTPDYVQFELVNPKDIPLEVLIYNGGTFVAKTKYNTGTTLTPNNRDYVRIASGGWVTFKWFNRQNNYQWVVFGDLI